MPTPIICTHCGAPLAIPAARRCDHCGFELSAPPILPDSLKRPKPRTGALNGIIALVSGIFWTIFSLVFGDSTSYDVYYSFYAPVRGIRTRFKSKDFVSYAMFKRLEVAANWMWCMHLPTRKFLR